MFVGPAPGRSGETINGALGDGPCAKRMQSLLECDRRRWLSFRRTNLCHTWPGTLPGGKGDAFDMRNARRAAHMILVMNPKVRKLVLLGANVAGAFDLHFHPLCTVSEHGRLFFLMPHPSGVNHFWNDLSRFDQASTGLRRFLRMDT